MLKTKLKCLLLSLNLALAPAAMAGLPGGISGTWYNPTQSGHGLNIDLLAANRAIVIWHVFDPSGRPLTLYVDAQVNGRQMAGTVFAPTGMRFGSFNPADVSLLRWGRVEIDIADCDNGQLRWFADDPSFGNGQTTLLRLSQALGSDCQLPPQNSLPAGLYHGQMAASPGRSASRLEGIVDREGRLWGLERYDEFGSDLRLPGPTYVGAMPVRVLKAEPISVSSGTVVVKTAIHSAQALAVPTNVQIEGALGEWTTGDSPSGKFEPSGRAIWGVQDWSRGATAGRTLLTPISMAELAGEYRIPVSGQFFGQTARLAIANDGSACFKFLNSENCEFVGEFGVSEGQFGLFDFKLIDQKNRALSSYQGRGWLADRASGRELVLVGDNGTQGIAMMGLRATEGQSHVE